MATLHIEKNKSVAALAAALDIVFAETSDPVNAISITYNGQTYTVDDIKRILKNQDLVLSSKQYGNTLPSTGVEGQIFFLKQG